MLAITIDVATADALSYEADVLVLKHAQELYGADRQAFSRLEVVHPDLWSKLPEDGDCLSIATLGILGAKRVFFVGVPPLKQFSYDTIRPFAQRALAHLAGTEPEAEHVALTIHGVGSGLNEREAFRAEIGGLASALGEGRFPEALRRITIVNRGERTADRLRMLLSGMLPRGQLLVELKQGRVEDAPRPSACAAMPFHGT